VNEGQTATNTGTWSDANAGDTVTLSASVGTVTKSGTNASGTWSWSFATTDGPAQSQTVTITANDGNGGVTSTTFSLTVNNVAPTATFNAPTSVNEGSNINISLTSPSDPSSVDTTAGFTYAFDCGSGYGAFSGTSTATCSTNDNGSRTVKGKVKDKDVGETEYTATVTINNVAPTATFNAPTSVNEGSNINISLTSPSDPSSVDTTAGFTYAFDCGSGYGAFGASNSTSCSTNDNGSRTVKGKIKDKDGGETEYTATVTINNVAPTATLANNGPVNEGSPATISFSAQFDPSSVDTTAGFHYAYSCTNSSLAGATYAGSGTSASTACTFNDDGVFTVRARIIDKDNGFSEYTTNVTVQNVPPTIAWTLHPNPVNEDKSGSETYSFSISDPGADTFTYVSGYPKCGPNGSLQGSPTIGLTSGSFQCRFSDGPADSLVEVKVNDGEDDSNLQTENVHVNNVAPTVNLSGAGTVDEGTSEWYTFTLSDPGADTFSFPTGYPTCGAHGNLLGSPVVADGKFQCNFPDGPNTTDVAVKVQDDDGGVSTPDVAQVDIIPVTVNNVPPTVTAPIDQSSNEGESKSFMLGSFTDPGTDANWTVDVNWGDTHTGSFAVGSTGTIPATSHTYDDNGEYTVTVKVTDKDLEYDSKTFKITVANVAPTANFPATRTVNEGSSSTFNFTTQFDPSGADTTAGFHYAYSCMGAALGSTPYASSGTSDSVTCPASDFDDGPGSQTVRARIIDKDDGYTEYTTAVTIQNVAPSATFNAPSSVDEGSSIAISLTSPSDPSTADTTAGFTYAFDCGDGAGYGSYGASNSASCPTSDNGLRTVKGTIKDKDNGEREYTASVNVKNVAPNVAAASDQSADEGQNKSYSLGSFSDPGADSPWSVDVNWGDGSAHTTFTQSSTGSLGNRSHAYGDNGNYTVKVTVTDKDGGSGYATFTAQIGNVAPTASNGTFTYDPVLGTATASFNFADVGWLDTHSLSFFNWSSGSPGTKTVTEENVAPDATGTATETRTFVSGCYNLTVTGTAKDDDGGQSAPLSIFSGSTTAIYANGFRPPIQDNERNIAKWGNVVPVKVVLTNPCTGASITDVSLFVQLVKGVNGEYIESNNVVTESVSAADSGQQMRVADGMYIYNLSTKNLVANSDYAVQIKLGSLTGPTILQAVLQPKK
jgi:hypothetical protein